MKYCNRGCCEEPDTPEEIGAREIDGTTAWDGDQDGRERVRDHAVSARDAGEPARLHSDQDQARDGRRFSREAFAVGRGKCQRHMTAQ